MLNNPIQLGWQHVFKGWFISLFKLDLETTHPMGMFLQAIFMVCLFCSWNWFMANYSNCIGYHQQGFFTGPTKTYNMCTVEVFKGNLAIVIACVCLLWLYPIFKTYERNATMNRQFVSNLTSGFNRGALPDAE
jgi:hypothetical protein